MRYAIMVGLVAAMLFGREPATGQERGILPFKATIVKVHDKSLELSLVDRNDDIARGQPVRFDVVKDTRFEEVDFELVDGKLQMTRKAITLGDLLPTQPINVIAIIAGSRPIILVGVVAGGRASGAEALKLIAKLGGTVRNFAWTKGETRYDVDLSDSKITDDALPPIASMDDLFSLNLSNTKITDKGIAHLANHPSLTDVVLSGTRVTNGALTHLSKVPKLDRVSVDQTAVTREAVLRFAKKQGLSSFCQIGAGPKCEYRVHEELRAARHENTPYVYLMRRNVLYARFYPDDAARRKPTTYYHRNGPVGAVLWRFEWFPQDEIHANHSDARLPASLVALSAAPVGGLPTNALACLWSEPAIGVVELNGGTIAAYGRPFQTMDFYNDIPELTRFNIKVDGKDPPFGFIEDARSRGCNLRVIDGPFKKTVRKDAPRGFYSAIFVDITVQQRQDPKTIKKEDVHFDLLTQEGLGDLMDKTTPDGVVCFHTSHRTHEFYKPLSAAAAALGFAAKKVNDDVYDRNAKAAFADGSHFGSEWLVVARRPEHLARFRSERSKTRNLSWDVPSADEAPAWRDGVEPEMPIRLR
jgi:hypothetical protein